MAVTQVYGFNDDDPKYRCCCHYRICSIIIALFCLIVGGIGVGGAIVALFEGKNVLEVIFGAGASICLFVAGAFLLMAVIKEKAPWTLPFLVLCVVEMVLAIIQTVQFVIKVCNDFENPLSVLNSGNYCQKYGLDRCDSNSKYFIIAAGVATLVVNLLLIGFFFVRVYRTRTYLKDKDAARGGGYQMGVRA